MGIKGFVCSIAAMGLISSFPAYAGKANDTLVYASDCEAQKSSPYHNSIRLHLEKSSPLALEYMSNAVPMFPKHYIKKVGLAEFGRKPVGTGPYKAVSVVACEGLIMEITKDYFTDSPRGQPHIGNMKFRVIPDAETRLA